KYENALDRITAAANPRPIERVPAGTDFTFEMIYDVENLDHLQDDLHNLAFCLSVLEDDYLGGHGSRGYGKVKIWLTRVVVKKVEAYLSPSDEHQKVIIDGQEIDRKNPTERPEDVKPVDAFRDAIDKIVEFLKEEK
ncbi:MAG: type III-A CRISPR-associated RAMP protein Csm3, partial [Deltaproteobacteria bacterium]